MPSYWPEATPEGKDEGHGGCGYPSALKDGISIHSFNPRLPNLCSARKAIVHEHWSLECLSPLACNSSSSRRERGPITRGTRETETGGDPLKT